jgi:hypothetical protein
MTDSFSIRFSTARTGRRLCKFRMSVRVSGFDGKSWAADVQVPNVSMSNSPSAVALPGGGISVFYQGPNNNGELWYSYFAGGTWAPAVHIQGAGISSSPSAVALPGGGISVFHQGLGNNGQLWYSYFDSKNWQQDLQVPNVGISSAPSAVAY